MRRRPPRSARFPSPTVLRSPRRRARATRPRELVPHSPIEYASRTAMATATLDFEKPIVELEKQIDELKRLAGDRQLDVAEERSEEHTSELQSRHYLVCRLLL